MDKVTVLNFLKSRCEAIECDGISYTKEGVAEYDGSKHSPTQVIPKELSSEFGESRSRQAFGISVENWTFEVKLNFQTTEVDQGAILTAFNPVPRLKIVDTIYHVLLTRTDFEHPTTQNRSRGSTVTLNVIVKPITK